LGLTLAEGKLVLAGLQPRIRCGAVRLVNRAVYPCRINRIFSHSIACMLRISNHGEPSSNQMADFA
jgi:hypothetical protein